MCSPLVCSSETAAERDNSRRAANHHTLLASFHRKNAVCRFAPKSSVAEDSNPSADDYSERAMMEDRQEAQTKGEWYCVFLQGTTKTVSIFCRINKEKRRLAYGDDSAIHEPFKDCLPSGFLRAHNNSQ
uniref:Secreted protein n=1 Tax=Steinernema glaseri TaxID=37863 RepID=A0A1I7YCI0_9BILA